MLIPKNEIRQFFISDYNTTSNIAQNEMIESSANHVRSKTINQLIDAGMYSIMVDEAKDKHTQNLSICVRFVNKSTSSVEEHFLSFVDLPGFDAKSMTDALQTYLTDN